MVAPDPTERIVWWASAHVGWSAMSSSGPGWRIGSLSGIPIYLGRSWVMVALIMVAIFGPTVQRAAPSLGLLAYAVALVFALLLLVSVLVHEAAHALVAQRVGFRVSRMVADFWGGHTAHDGAGGTPGRSAAVAVVGPLSNAALALLGWWLLSLLTAAGPGTSSLGALVDGTELRVVLVLLVYAFAWSNTFVAVFNLLPGLPLDGGFLLEALVWKVTGNRHLGTMVAGWAGRLVVLLVAMWVLAPLVQGDRPPFSRVLWALLIGGFLWQGASQAIRVGRHGVTASRRTVGEAAMTPGVVSGSSPLSTVAWGSRPIWVVLDAAGRPDGVVDGTTLAQVPASAYATTPISAVAVRLPSGWAVPMDPAARLDGVIEVMRSSQSGVIGLLDGEGRPWGVVVADDVAGRR